jgi:hypothetical protein
MSAPNYCPPCGENLLPEQTECPFCGQASVPVDDPRPLPFRRHRNSRSGGSMKRLSLNQSIPIAFALVAVLALAAAAEGGDVKQAPGEAPQSGPATQGNAPEQSQ